jgi:hypothetical protein
MLTNPQVCVADLELLLAAAQHHESCTAISLAWAKIKIQNLKHGFY